MSKSSYNEHELDALLNAWAARHALPAPQAEMIRRAITLTPEPFATEMSIAWWHRLFGTLATAMRQSTDISRYLCYLQK